MHEFSKIIDYVMARDFEVDFEFIRMNSYSHPNGFIKVVLPSQEPEVEEYRLHFWGGDKRQVTDIHNHTSSFDSLVIEGTIQENVYKKSNGSSYRLYKCSPRSSNGEATLTESQHAEMLLAKANVFHTRQSYHISVDSFHEVVVEKGKNSITLVKQHRKVRNYSYVAKPTSEKRATVRLSNPPLSREDTVILLDKCYNAVRSYQQERLQNH